MALRVYNRFTGRKEEFKPLDDNRVGIYFCGITVQGEPHVGHMLAFVSADVIRRYLIFKGYDVTYIQNFTDVDDKIITKANELGVEPAELAEKNIESFFNASDTLNIKRADIYPRATEHIEDIINLIQTLQEKGFAYEAGGDVYYRVRKFDEYGKLSGRKVDELKVGARIAEGEQKEDPLDFTLWKAAKEGEPYWDSPWGRGRPGWHIECSAMSMKYLGNTLDMHGGGEDLVFPHHENEIAQSEAATGERFVNYWLHNGLLNLEGEKMSKSTSHFFSFTEVNEEFSGEVIRFYLISTHFRSRSEFSRKRLEEAEAGLDRIRNMCVYLDEIGGGEGEGSAGKSEEVERLEELAQETGRKFMEAMDDDFNSAEAIGHIFHLVREFNRVRSMPEADLSSHPDTARSILKVMEEFNSILGMFKGGLPAAEAEVPEEVVKLVRERDQAREERDWEKADRLRDRVQELGYVIEDGPGGARVKPAR